MSVEYDIHQISKHEVLQLQSIARTTFRSSYAWGTPEYAIEDYIQNQLSIPQLELELDQDHSKFYAWVDPEGFWLGYAKLNLNIQAIDRDYQNPVQLQRLYFLPEAQGNGLGKVFLNQLILQSIAEGCTFMWLTVWPKNEHAIRFYKKMGFVQDGFQDFHYANRIESDFLLVKRLD